MNKKSFGRKTAETLVAVVWLSTMSVGIIGTALVLNTRERLLDLRHELVNWLGYP